MDTIWDYSPRLEAMRLLHCGHQIATGFFKINGFIVLPYPTLVGDNIVSIPNIKYLSVPRFWQRASRLDVSSLPLKAPEDLLSETENLIKISNLPIPNYKSTQALWEKNKHEILDIIFKLVPHKKGSVSKIIVNPTAFGTGCSFNRHLKSGDPIIIWLREDQGVSAIAEAILTSLTRQDVYDTLGGLWQESEIIVDWLLTFSPLGEILKRIDPDSRKTLTIKHTRTKQAATLIQRSEKFLRSIGAPVTGIPAIQNVPTHNFTPREKEILDAMIARSPSPISMDQIGDILFKDNLDAFSLSAVAKAMQRLRDKLEKAGVSGSHIQTKRGEGYLLIS